LKILIIVHNQTNTNPFYKVFEMSMAISDKGNEVTILCTSPKKRFFSKSSTKSKLEIFESPDLLWGHLRQGIDIWNIFHRLLFVMKNDFDVVHAIDCRPVVIFPALFLKIFKKTKLVLSWWDLFGSGATALERSGKFYVKTLGKVEIFFEEKFRKYADYSIVVTSLLKKKLMSLGLAEQSIKVLRVGAKKNQFNYYHKESARKILNLPEKSMIFCYAGAIFQRDMELLLKALSILKLKCVSNYLTIVIGRHKIQPDICSALNIKLIERLPELKDVYLYFNASDYGLLPFNVSISNQARWPSKISDYIAASLPIITTPVSDLTEIFSRYNPGILSMSDSPDDYSKALMQSFSTSEEEYQSKIINCRELMKNELDWQLIAGETSKIYESVVNK